MQSLNLPSGWSEKFLTSLWTDILKQLGVAVKIKMFEHQSRITLSNYPGMEPGNTFLVLSILRNTALAWDSLVLLSYSHMQTYILYCSQPGEVTSRPLHYIWMVEEIIKS